MIASDKVRVQTFVRVAQRKAFDVFTLELDAWWRKGIAYRIGGAKESTLSLEPALGGRVVERYGKGKEHELGRITAWEPPNHFAFSWRGINFGDADPSTTVEVWFEASGEGTRVTLEHRGFAALRDDHPVRHGKPTDEFLRDLGMWWGSLATSLRLYAEGP